MISMINSLPWDEIAIPDRDYNVRLIPDGGEIPIYWGKNSQGELLFLISLSGDHRNIFTQEKLSIRGIDIDIRKSVTTERQLLVLTLDRLVDSDLFYTLCKSLFLSLKNINRSDVALSVAMQHLKRWRIFLAGGNAHLLNAQQYRGLFAELTFLDKLLKAGLHHVTAISSWTGPDRIHQDFIFSGRSVEIKSLSSSDRNTVRISSEAQLESIEEKLYLLTLTLQESQDNPMAFSLNTLVAYIRELLPGDAQESFDIKLAASGYTFLPEYEAPKLMVTNTKAYLIEKDFPRIIRPMLPAGVISVSYQLELEKLEPFSCAFEMILEAL